jgi:hypothetical protein
LLERFVTVFDTEGGQRRKNLFFTLAVSNSLDAFLHDKKSATKLLPGRLKHVQGFDSRVTSRHGLLVGFPTKDFRVQFGGSFDVMHGQFQPANLAKVGLRPQGKQMVAKAAHDGAYLVLTFAAHFEMCSV